MNRHEEEILEKQAGTALVAGCAGIIAFVVAVVAILLLCGCSPKIVERTEYVHDTVATYQLQRDSIFQHDSIYLHEYQRGDTVYLTKDHFSVRFQDRLIHDSIYISTTDTIVTTDTVTVPKQLTRWQRLKMNVGGIALSLLAIILGLWIWRKIRE